MAEQPDENKFLAELTLAIVNGLTESIKNKINLKKISSQR